MTAQERDQAFAVALDAEEPDRDPTQVTPPLLVGQLAERTKTPAPTPAPGELSEYEQGLADFAAVLIDEVQMPQRVVEMFADLARARRAGR